MGKPLVSICISCYNHEKFVGTALKKALEQTYPNTEILISDDGSTDGSRDVILNMIKEYPEKTVKTFFSEENTSFRVVREMYDSISGEYIATISADDYWEETAVEKYMEFMEQHEECAVSFCVPHTFVEEGEKGVSENTFVIENMPENRYKWFEFLVLGGNKICAPSTFIRSSVWKEMGGWKHEYLQLQDYEMWLQILQRYEIFVFQEGEIPIYYRCHNNNLSAPTDEAQIRDLAEREYLFYHLFNEVEQDFFVRAFEEHLKYPENSEQFCLTCEKFMIMLNAVFIPTKSAVMFYYTHIQDEDFKEHIEKDYFFVKKNLYWLTGKDDFLEAVINKVQQVMAEQLATIEKQDKIIEELFRKIDYLMKAD